MTTGPTEPGEESRDEFDRRLAEVERLREQGIDPYPVRFDRDRTTASLREEFGGLAPGTETGVRAKVAGGVLLIGRQGKLAFATLRDGTGIIQLFVSQAEVGEEGMAAFERLDLGDWVGAEGEVMTTRRGELSVKVRSFTLLAKSLHPLPDKWHGLTDVDTRFRRRRGPALRHPPQRPGHGPLPAHRPRAVPEAAAGGRVRAGLRDRAGVPQRGPLYPAQPRVHDAGGLRGLRRLHRHDAPHRGAGGLGRPGGDRRNRD